MGAVCFDDTLLQIMFLQTYTLYMKVCNVFRLIRLLLQIPSSKFWITHLNNVIVEVGTNMPFPQLWRVSFSWLNMSSARPVQQARTNSEKKSSMIFSLIKPHKTFLAQFPHSLYYSSTKEPPHFRMIKEDAHPMASFHFRDKFIKLTTFRRTFQYCFHNFYDIGHVIS